MSSSRSLRIHSQHGIIINISSSSTTRTITTTSSSSSSSSSSSYHVSEEQQDEVQATTPSGNSHILAGTHTMDRPVQTRTAQIDIRPGETQSELLRRVLIHFGLPPDLLHEVRASGENARTDRAGADTFVFRNQRTQEITEVLFDQASSGVTYNVAVRSQQFNTAVGPGARVCHNHATDAEQRNCAICIVM